MEIYLPKRNGEWPELEKAQPGLKIYLACKYTGTEEEQQRRFERINKVAAKLMEEGYIVFSPISHTHPIGQHVCPEKNTHEFWMSQDYAFLDWCDILFVLVDDDYTTSKGVTEEIEYIQKHKKTSVYGSYKNIFKTGNPMFPPQYDPKWDEEID